MGNKFKIAVVLKLLIRESTYIFTSVRQSMSFPPPDEPTYG
jgi:hypothetical protein